MLRDLFVYLLGGVTFVPLCVLIFLLCEQTENEHAEGPDGAVPVSQPPLTPQAQQAAQTLLAQQQAREAELKSTSSGSRDDAKVLASWVIVKNTYRTLPRKSDVCFHRDGSRRAPSKRDTVGHDEDDDEAPETDGARKQRSYMSYAYRAMRGGLGGDSPAAKGDEATPMTMPGADSGQTQDERGVYYAILKPPMLYIYNNDDMTKPGTECVATVNLTHKRISLWVREVGDVEGDLKTDGERPVCSESSLFTKRSAIHVATPAARRGEHWYIMTPRASQLEDWYFALLDATRPRHARSSTIDKVFDADAMASLVQHLDDRAEEVPLRWLNAMLGRIFTAVAHTAAMDAAVFSRLSRRVQRLRPPRFINDVRLVSIDMGSTAPTFGRPVLKQLAPDGTATMEVSTHYRGNMRIVLSATLSIPLGQRFKSYNVSVVVAVVLRSLEGTLLLQIKPPPSNRVWYGFTAMPKMDIGVEPVISARKVRWSLITGLLESRARQSVADNLVVPHMHSFAFFSTQHEARRGGLWNEMAAKHPEPEVKRSGSAPTPAASEVPTSLSETAVPALVMSPEDEAVAAAALASPSSAQSSSSEASSAMRGLSTFLSNQSTTSLSSDSASDRTGSRRRDKYRAWLSTKVGSTSYTPSNPIIRSNTDLGPVPHTLPRRLSDSDMAQADDASQVVDTTHTEARDTDTASIAHSEDGLRASDSTLSMESSSTAESATEHVEAAPPTRVPPEVPKRTESTRREETVRTLPAPPTRSVTYDEYGEIPSAAPKKSRINTLARTLQDTMDRDGRQIIARDAKDALKRSWNNWNAKRAENKKGATARLVASTPKLEHTPEASVQSIPRIPPPPPPRKLDPTALAVLEMPSPAPSETLPMPTPHEQADAAKPDRESTPATPTGPQSSKEAPSSTQTSDATPHASQQRIEPATSMAPDETSAAASAVAMASAAASAASETQEKGPISSPASAVASAPTQNSE
ncbi:hypothetical protein MBRA1_000279 [Malassezia brasiliensis]|uniref:SMP-LTD domain-containing protein n=1 Tax=Malassezia brasiliensis TaxID=1821822 RepID=A0AAF0DQR1_9BASI|nr:hypothetical protein MBRA1_000279 [Malassezia brasiliensis]